MKQNRKDANDQKVPARLDPKAELMKRVPQVAEFLRQVEELKALGIDITLPTEREIDPPWNPRLMHIPLKYFDFGTKGK